jgi:hypothetical protein
LKLKSFQPLPGSGEENEMSTSVTLIISVILALVAAVVHFANIEHPAFPTRGFVLLLIAYLVLLAGEFLGM